MTGLRWLLPVLVIGSVAVPPSAWAAEADARIRALERRLETQQEQIEAQQKMLESLRDDRLQSDARAASHSEEVEHATEETIGVTELGGYGVINYLSFDYETQPNRGDETDVERFILEVEHRFSPNWSFEAEVEFEHGGTGVTRELDRFEEFGEFEQEIESGGEVAIEELYVSYEPNPLFGVRAGEIIVPVGLLNAAHRPQDYFTAQRPASETSLVPVTWHETGVEVFGEYAGLSYQAMVINGLDSTGFSTRGFIAGGRQSAFETDQADALAAAGALNYELFDGVTLGGSLYIGDTSTNRPRSDIDDIDGSVAIWDVHARVRRGPWTLRALYLHGQIDNSDEITRANRNLSSNLDSPATSVGNEAESASVELGYDFLPLLGALPGARLDGFLRVASYDSQSGTVGTVVNNGISERDEWTVGVNYSVFEDLLFKADYTYRERGIERNNVEETVAAGLGFTF